MPPRTAPGSRLRGGGSNRPFDDLRLPPAGWSRARQRASVSGPEVDTSSSPPDAAKGHRSLGAALFFVAFGVLALWLGRDLAVGTAGEMGIGYTPRMLAIGCIGVGVLLLVEALAGRARREAIAFAWRPAIFVTVLVLGFALLLPRAGLPVTIVVLTVAAGASGEAFRWPVLLATAFALALLATALFGLALKLQVPVWPAW